MARIFSQLIATSHEDAIDGDRIAIDGKTLRGSTDANSKAVHVVSAFCMGTDQMVGHTSSRGKGMEIPDALKLIKNIDLAGKTVTGDAMFCQREITGKIVGKGGDYVIPVKGNQKDLRDEIITAFDQPVFPLRESYATPEANHGRIEQRSIAVLPAEVPGTYMRNRWPTIKSIASIERTREHMRGGKITKTENETVWLISRFENPDPEKLLIRNRQHWAIEIMHRDKDVILGEDYYTNRLDHAPKNIFTLLSATRTLLKFINKSPTIAIEMVQNKRGCAVQFIAGRKVFL